MTRIALSRQHNRMGFTLIELTTSLAVMSVLLLGLSGAVMVSSRAIPTTTETGLADQNTVDVLDMLRADLASSASVQYRTDISGWVLTLAIKPTGASGEPSAVVYTFNSSAKTLDRKVDSRTGEIVLSSIQVFAVNLKQSGGDAYALYALVSVENTIQRFFEFQSLLPDKPGVL